MRNRRAKLHRVTCRRAPHPANRKEERRKGSEGNLRKADPKHIVREKKKPMGKILEFLEIRKKSAVHSKSIRSLVTRTKRARIIQEQKGIFLLELKRKQNKKR